MVSGSWFMAHGQGSGAGGPSLDRGRAPFLAMSHNHQGGGRAWFTMLWPHGPMARAPWPHGGGSAPAPPFLLAFGPPQGCASWSLWEDSIISWCLMLDAWCMLDGSWLMAQGSWLMAKGGQGRLMARGRPGPGDPEARRAEPGPEASHEPSSMHQGHRCIRIV